MPAAIIEIRMLLSVIPPRSRLSHHAAPAAVLIQETIRHRLDRERNVQLDQVPSLDVLAYRSFDTRQVERHHPWNLTQIDIGAPRIHLEPSLHGSSRRRGRRGGGYRRRGMAQLRQSFSVSP